MKTRHILIEAVLPIPEHFAQLVERLAEHRGCDPGDIMNQLIRDQAEGIVERLCRDLVGEIAGRN